jgi:hypothetical protein
VVAAVVARAADASASSFWRQQCLYLRPDPQRQISLRPGRAAGEPAIQPVYRIVRGLGDPTAAGVVV